MIIVSMMYPSQDGGTFNINYCLTTHIPMVTKLMASALKGVSVYSGFSGRGARQQAFAPKAKGIWGDIPNYTNIQPIIQIGELKLDQT